MIRVATSSREDVEEAVAELAAQLGEEPCAAVLFFASSRYPMVDLATCMTEVYPDAITAGCTTTGEVGPHGLTTGGIVAMAFGAECGVSAVAIDLKSFLFEDGGRIVSELVSRIRGEPIGLASDKHVFVTLTDGLSGKEEMLVASLGTHAPGIPLVGGSAGDDFRFERTWVALDGQAFGQAAVVMLIEPHVPFEAFHLHHFQPTEERLVVTAADPNRRLVRELDGWPAVEVLAKRLGLQPDELRHNARDVLFTRPVAFAFRVGTRFFLRTVMTVIDDALWMGGAVEVGSVLRWMTPGDLVDETAKGVQGALEASPREPAGLLLFNCGGRLREAAQLGVVPALYAAMCPPGVPACGFTTYGEQYGPMQVNSTLTGLVLFQSEPPALLGADRRGTELAFPDVRSRP